MLAALRIVLVLALSLVTVRATTHTSTPSSTPTSLPTSLPTILPTSTPTGMPTVDTGTRAPSARPTNPTEMPTAAPTWAPTEAVTDIPVGTSVVIFGVALGYDGVNAVTWNANLAQNNAAVCAATTSTLGLPKSSCSVTDVTDTSTRRQLHLGRALAANPSVSVTTELSAPATSSSAAYISTLNTAVSSGSFQGSVQTAAASQGAADLLSVVVPTSQSATTVGSTVTSVATAVPSPMPSAMPTAGPKDDADPATSVGAIVGYCLGGALLVGLAGYFFMQSSQGNSNKVMVQTGGDQQSQMEAGSMSPVVPMVAITKPQ